MLTRRLIPCLDIKNGRVVKGVQFKDLKDAGDAVTLAEKYDRDGADEIAFLDITASQEGRKTFLDLLSQVAERVFVPLAAGGGVTSVEDVGQLLRAGADKVTINTAAVTSPDILTGAAHAYGSQCVVLAIDARRNSDGRWQVCTHGGTRGTVLDAVEWAATGVSRGAGEILLTSMDADGCQTGYDLDLTKAVSEAVDVPIIASGGAGTSSDIVEVLTRGGAQAALLASLLHFGQTTIPGIKADLHKAGIPVRPLPDLESQA